MDDDTLVVADVSKASMRLNTGTANGVPWATWLRARLAGREVTCVPAAMARCFLRGEDLNGRMLDFRRYTRAYLDGEKEAKRKKVGLWRGDFEPPWEWRRSTQR